MAKGLPEFTGTYKAMILSNVVEPSNKAKIPTLKLQVYLLEFYDVKEDEWINVEEEHWTMAAYLTLFSKEGDETLNHQQAVKVFDWDGCGFGALCSPDIEGKFVQIRIKESANEKFPMEISWIDTEDTDPKGGFKRATAEDIANLDKQFSHLLRSGKGSKGVSAKSNGPARGSKKTKTEEPAETDAEEQPAETEAGSDMSADDKKKALLAKSRRLRKEQEQERRNKANGSGPPKKLAAKGKKNTKGRVITGDEMPDDFGKKDAWYTITDLRDAACDDDLQATEWSAAIEDIAENGDEDKLDASGWWTVKNRVLANIGND